MAVRPPAATVSVGSARAARANAQSNRAPTQSSNLTLISCSFVVRQGTHDIAAGFFVALEHERAATLRLLEQPVERAKAVVRLGEPGLPAFERLLDHRAPDLFFRAALRNQCFDRRRDQVDGVLPPFVLALPGRWLRL